MAHFDTVLGTRRFVWDGAFSLRQAAITLSLAAGAVFLVDALTPPLLDVPIFYLFVVLLCLRCPREVPPIGVAALCVALSFVPPLFFWASPLSPWIFLNRVIAAVALAVTGILVSNRRTIESALRESQIQLGRRVEERTADLLEANRRLTEQDQIRTRFLSVVSHELRTPMAAIKGFVENMLNGVTGPVTEQQGHYLARIRTNVDRLTRLIEQILDWSRLELGGLRLTLKPVALNELARGVVENAKGLAGPKNIVLTLRADKELPVIQADQDKLEQILWNLVGNAIKFTPEREQVTVECRLDGHEHIELMVSDTGCGIPPEDLPRVFEQFSGIMTAHLPLRGAQLGLYITKRLVLLHGGRIWAESDPGKGSRFYIRLPLAGPDRPGLNLPV